MTRPKQFFLWAVGGAVLLTAGSLVPAQFRAVDVKVVERGGIGTLSLVQAGLNLVSTDKIGPARMFERAAEMLDVPSRERLSVAVARSPQRNSPAFSFPNASALLPVPSGGPAQGEMPSIIEVLMMRKAREGLIEFLESSGLPVVREVLQNRTLTNTVRFPPAASSAGQPFDAVIALTGLLLRGDFFAPMLREEIDSLARQANRGGAVEPLESIYMDLLSFGRRLEWTQLCEFMRKVENANALHDLAAAVREQGEKLPVLYAAVVLSVRPAQVGKYLAKFPTTGMEGLSAGVRGGQGALLDLLQREQRVHVSPWRMALIEYDPFGTFFRKVLPTAQRTPLRAIVFRCLLILAGAFCVGRAIEALALAETFKGIDGFPWAHVIHTSAFALVMSTFILLFSEPFLFPEARRVDFPIRLQLPVAGSAMVTQIQKAIQPIMSAVTLASLLIFFVLQALIYIWCLRKVAEIRRQSVGPVMKLRLLENEDHLFDAGLYLGFVGTVISLILVSIGIIQSSLMAAYSSTSFGIIFVSILKIFHVRPFRRELILESGTQS